MGGFFGGDQTISNAETPFSAFQIQSSAYGMAMCVLYGRNRIAGNLLWYSDFTAVAHTTSSEQSGGKGGGGITTESTTYTYTCSFVLGLGEGPITSVNALWVDKEYFDNADVFTKFLGGYTQAPWGYLTSKHPGEALAYHGTAYVCAADYDLGNSSSLGNHNFDVTGHLPYQAGVIDGANPRDIIADIISNAAYGADPDAAYVDSWLDFSNYCIANNIFLSPAYDAQSEARQCLSDIIRLANSGIFYSEGKIKIVPYSDASVTGNGVTFTPVTAAAYDLTDNDFLDDEQPVRVLRTPNADAYNQVQIEFKDKISQYNTAIAAAQDQASIELFGLRPMEKITAHGITDAETARFVAQLILQRVLYSRNTYEFKVGWRYARLEPCDYVTLTDARLGLDALPVRILSIEESEDGELSMTAEDAPPGILASPLYDAPSNDGYIVNLNVPPGDVAPPQFFEVPPTRSLSGLAIGVAVTGQLADWGGAEIWASNDGTSYAMMGRVWGGARYGTLASAVTEAADQVARVTLAGKGGSMFSGSIDDANALSTLCLIENEFVGHTTSTLIAANVYDLTLALRALYSTTAAGHAAGSRFIRVDDAIAYSDALELSMIGKTLHFKFLSYNKHGAAKQQLADVTAYTYTISGSMAQLPPPALFGLDVTATANCNIVTWTNPAPDSMDRVEVWRSTTDQVGDAVLAGTVRGAVGIFTDYLGAGGVTMYYWVRSINLQGFPSAYLGPASATTGEISVTLADGSVITAKLATKAVTATKIDDNAIETPHLSANSVTAAAIAANAILAEKIAADAVTAAKIKAGEIQTSHLAAYAVTADKIDSRGLSIKDGSGNIILAAGTALNWTNITGQPSDIYNVNVTLTGLGYTGALDATKNTGKTGTLASRPTTNTVGDTYYATDTGLFYVCTTAPNTWTTGASKNTGKSGLLSARPTTNTVGDTYYATDTSLLYVCTTSPNTWTAFANNYSNTSQLTDGANLGGTAAWAGVTNIPYETIYTNDDSVSLGFNPTFSNWTATYPNNWVTFAGSAPTKETTIKKVGEYAVRYVAAGSNIGMYCTASFTTNPLPLGTFLSGTTDIYMVSRTSGLPGIMVRLYTNSGLTTYVDTLAQPGGTTTAVWYRVPWTARVGAAQQIYGIRIYVLASYTAFASGSFTGTAIFDNLQFALFDASVDNKAITMAANGSLTGGGGGQVTLAGLGAGTLATKNSVNWSTEITNIPAFGNFAYLSSITSANISTYIAGAAIGTGYIADAAITSAKIADANVGTLKIQGNAITVPVSASGTFSASTASLDFGGASVCIIASGTLSKWAGISGNMEIMVYRNGELIKTVTVPAASDNEDSVSMKGSATVCFVDYPGAGSFYYTVNINNGGNLYAGQCGILALGVKR